MLKRIKFTNFRNLNGDKVSGGNHYYKVEPIRWRYLGEKDGNPLFVSEYILDKQEYGTYYSDTKSKTDYQGNTATVYANNYKYSEIRTWLNTTFLDQAFYYVFLSFCLIIATVVIKVATNYN